MFDFERLMALLSICEGVNIRTIIINAIRRCSDTNIRHYVIIILPKKVEIIFCMNIYVEL